MIFFHRFQIFGNFLSCTRKVDCKTTDVTPFWIFFFFFTARRVERQSKKSPNPNRWCLSEFCLEIRAKNYRILNFTEKKIFFWRQNGPATARPFQEGRFWKRSETKKRTPLKMSLLLLYVFLSFWATTERDIEHKIDRIIMHCLKEDQQ